MKTGAMPKSYICVLLATAIGGSPVAAKEPKFPIPECDGAEACQVAWGKALRWVLDHNGRIAQQTDSFISTAPVEQTGEDYFQVSRIPLGGERFQIEMKMECANMFACKLKRRKTEFFEAVDGRPN